MAVLNTLAILQSLKLMDIFAVDVWSFAKYEINLRDLASLITFAAHFNVFSYRGLKYKNRFRVYRTTYFSSIKNKLDR